MRLYVIQLLTLLLASLQMIAPLVHAHVDNTQNKSGLHIHELEFISSIPDTSPELHHTQLHTHSTTFHIGTGITQKEKNIDNTAIDSLPVDLFLLITVHFNRPLYPPPFSQLNKTTWHNSFVCARAPPQHCKWI